MRFLLHPGETLHDAAQQLLALAATLLQRAWPALIVMAVLLVAGTIARRYWHARRLTDGARSLAILPPPEVDSAGAAALWANLHGLIRPSWQVRLAGQPHLAFELTATPHGLELGLWVPGTVPQGSSNGWSQHRPGSLPAPVSDVKVVAGLQVWGAAGEGIRPRPDRAAPRAARAAAVRTM